jgi:hypothetical protein
MTITTTRAPLWQCVLAAAACMMLALPAAAQPASDGAAGSPQQIAQAGVMLQRLQSMPELVLSLFGDMEKIADYKSPRAYPRVHQVSRPELEREACAGHACWAVKAAYVRDKALLYVDSALDLHTNILDRSILLHELVHHMQNLTQRYADLPPCTRYRVEEREAFEIQNAYLAQFTPRHYIPFVERMYQCDARE